MGQMFGQDSTNKLIPLLVDASGRAILAATDSGGIVRPIKSDASGRIIVAGEDNTSTPRVLLTDNTGQLLTSAAISGSLPAGTNNIGDVDVLTMPVVTVQGKSSSAVLAYDGMLNYAKYEGSLAAGANTLVLTSIPASHIAVVTNIVAGYLGTVGGVTITGAIYDGSGYALLFELSNLTSGKSYDKQGYWFVPTGGSVRLLVANATLNDDAWIYAAGYFVATS